MEGLKFPWPARLPAPRRLAEPENQLVLLGALHLNLRGALEVARDALPGSGRVLKHDGDKRLLLPNRNPPNFHSVELDDHHHRTWLCHRSFPFARTCWHATDGTARAGASSGGTSPAWSGASLTSSRYGRERLAKSATRWRAVQPAYSPTRRISKPSCPAWPEVGHQLSARGRRGLSWVGAAGPEVSRQYRRQDGLGLPGQANKRGLPAGRSDRMSPAAWGLLRYCHQGAALMYCGRVSEHYGGCVSPRTSVASASGTA
jgi:hypothetical protein